MNWVQIDIKFIKKNCNFMKEAGGVLFPRPSESY